MIITSAGLWVSPRDIEIYAANGEQIPAITSFTVAWEDHCWTITIDGLVDPNATLVKTISTNGLFPITIIDKRTRKLRYKSNYRKNISYVETWGTDDMVSYVLTIKADSIV